MNLNIQYDTSMRLKRGAIREDGLIFWCYTKNCQGGEWWMTASQFEKCDSKAKADQLSRKSRLTERLESCPKIKRGTIKSDGKIFWGYNASARNGEIWLTPEKFKLKLAKRSRLNGQWNLQNPERMEYLKRKWDKANPEKVKFFQITQRHQRRAKKRLNGGSCTKEELQNLLEKAKGRCFYCHRKAKLSFDHVNPLKLGGSNSISNLVMACINCNSQKQAKDPLVYAKQIGRLLI